MIRSRQSGHAVLIVVIVVLALAVLGALGWVFWTNFINKTPPNTVTTFEQCKAAAGSVMQETSPEQCRTADGKTFIGPVANDADTGAVMTSYCSKAELLCFEYPKTWTLTDDSIVLSGGVKTDSLTVTSPDKALVLALGSGIDGIGGSCGDQAAKATTLQGIPVASMTGFADTYTTDVLQVARVVPLYFGTTTYYAQLYVTGSKSYVGPGEVIACDLAFSQFVNGRHAQPYAESTTSHGAFQFGYLGFEQDTSYATKTEALAAFDTQNYKEGAAILASLHYQ